MQVQYIKEYSNCLDREMEYKIYGQGGKLCLAIPSQNGRFLMDRIQSINDYYV